jgi:protein-tyrosine-phosphatase
VGIEAPNHPPQHLRFFSAAGAPPLDFVFTLSDTAAGEAPPVWPGQPFTAHWRCDDPEKYETEAERRLSLMRVRAELERRLRLLTNLPIASLDRLSLHKHLGN